MINKSNCLWWCAMTGACSATKCDQRNYSEQLLPYLKINPDKTLTGYLGDIWTTLEKALKFRTIFRSSRFSSAETLKRGEVDKWLGPVVISQRNTGHFVYSYEIGEIKYGLYTLSEEKGVSKWWYISIFSRGLWVMSFVSMIGITGLLLVVYRFKRAACRDYEECNNQLAIPSFNLLSILGVMTGQGFQEIPTAWSLRFIILSAVIMGMLISCGFSSTLTSFLAIRGNTLHFNNLADITQSKTHTLCVRNRTYAYEKLLTMAKNDSENWTDRINKNCPNMDNTIEFRDKLCRSGVIYVEVADVFISVYNPIHHKCNIVRIPGIHWSSKLTFLNARNSRHRHIINKYILRLRSAGILKYLERKWIPKEWPTWHERQLTFKTVEYAHVDLISLGLIAMVFVSSFICVLENIWFRVESRRARKNIAHLRLDRLKYLLRKAPSFPAVPLDPTSRRLWTTNEKN